MSISVNEAKHLTYESRFDWQWTLSTLHQGGAKYANQAH